MKALVIGATGFIGSHVARACLKEGWEVRITRRPNSPLTALEDIKDQVEMVDGDLNDVESLKAAMKGCDYVFCTAAYYPMYQFHIDRQKEMALKQVETLIEAVRASDVKRLIYTSSLSTIGKALPGQLANEQTAYDPQQHRGAYYQIKYACEQRLLEEAAKGFPVIIVNPTGVYGDYDVKPTSGIFVVMIAKGRVPVLVDALVNIVDVRDVGRGQVLAAQKGRLGERYILSNYNTKVMDFARMVAEEAGVAPPRCTVPLALLKTLAAASEYLGYYVLHQSKPFLPLVGLEYAEHGQHYDVSKAQRELGLKLTPVQETVKRSVRWFKEHDYF